MTNMNLFWSDTARKVFFPPDYNVDCCHFVNRTKVLAWRIAPIQNCIVREAKRFSTDKLLSHGHYMYMKVTEERNFSVDFLTWIFKREIALHGHYIWKCRRNDDFRLEPLSNALNSNQTTDNFIQFVLDHFRICGRAPPLAEIARKRSFYSQRI